jgi:TnpA family transposase
MVVHLVWLSTLSDAERLLIDIPHAKRVHFATEAKALDAAELKDFTLAKRYTLILALIWRARVTTRDHIVEMFFRRMATIHKRAKEELLRIQTGQRQTTESLVAIFSDILGTLENDPSDAEAGASVKHAHFGRGSQKTTSLPKIWGTGQTAAADGTQLELPRENPFASYHIRYGGYGGIAYHHVSDIYIALFSHFIPCGVWEAIYILEGSSKNKSDIQPDTVHADTQGQSAPVFGLAYLLGIKLMPRIRNWSDLKFFRPDKDSIYQHIDSLFSDPIDWELIETHWQDLMQVVLSIQAGKISSPMLLRKLGNYSRKNRLYRAFRELGRVVRTQFLLQYIADIRLREQITAFTNRVESYNGFSKWFAFGGEITNNDREEQEKVIKYIDLIANAVIFHNVVDMTNIIYALKAEGHEVKRENVSCLSPYLTRHIRRFGDYLVDMETLPVPLGEELLMPFF